MGINQLPGNTSFFLAIKTKNRYRDIDMDKNNKNRKMVLNCV